MTETSFSDSDGTSSDDGSGVSLDDLNSFLSSFGSELVSAEEYEGSELSFTSDFEFSDDETEDFLTAENELSDDESEDFLTADDEFSDDETEDYESAIDDTPSQETIDSIARANAAFDAGNWDGMRDEYKNAQATETSRAAMVTKMLTAPGNLDRLDHDKVLTAHLLASATVEDLRASDYLTDMTPQKINVLMDAIEFMSKPSITLPQDRRDFPQVERDLETFKMIAAAVPKKYWNDTERGMGEPMRGLGPRMCAALMTTGGYDEVCALIEQGVDTTRPAQKQRYDMATYSGFVTPLQHLVQPYLADIAKLDTPESADWDDKKREKVAGAKQVFEALEASGTAITVTSWEEVVESDLIDAFKENPGTIWGFEGIRGPYVEAAHDTDVGTQPVRMMEIWEAVAPVLSARDYAELLENPNKKIPEVIYAAVEQIEKDFNKKDKYAHARNADKKDKYIKAFVVAAQKFLETFAQQIPEGVLAREALTEDGHLRPSGGAIELSDLMGIDSGKYMGTIACRAGLWAAKDEGKPVYYVMDGINMQDVVDYKKVQHQTIEEYFAEGGATGSEDSFQEVITMQEVREILTHWDELGDTVKICIKGEILDGEELDAYIKTHQDAMKAADQEAGRGPAAPLDTFKKELNAIDGKIYGVLKKAVKKGADPKVVDMDARDIVLKSNYVMKIANARPSLVLKYLLSKCEVLFQYGLLAPELVRVATDLAAMTIGDVDPPTEQEVKAVASRTVTQLNKCTKTFRQPLAAALVKEPMLAHSAKLQKLGKK
jgi:hypothetical protein